MKNLIENEDDGDEVNFKLIDETGHAYIRGLGWITYLSKAIKNEAAFYLTVCAHDQSLPDVIRNSIKTDYLKVRRSEVMMDISAANKKAFE